MRSRIVPNQKVVRIHREPRSDPFSGDPFHQGFQLLFDADDQAVGSLDPAVQVTFLCADASLLHLLYQRPFMYRGDLLDALGFKAAVIDASFKTLSFKFSVHHPAPGFPPMLLPVCCIRMRRAGFRNRNSRNSALRSLLLCG